MYILKLFIEKKLLVILKLGSSVIKLVKNSDNMNKIIF